MPDQNFSKRIRTADGHTVYKGDRVFNYYDCWWGFINEDPDDEGWFGVLGENGEYAVLNGDRISIDAPKWFKDGK